MDKEELIEEVSFLSGELNDALGTAQMLESESETEKERLSELRQMIEDSLDYCNDLLDSL